MSYDAQVYQLVEHFLSSVPAKNTERNRQLLAQHIQDELEDWILLMLLPDAQQRRAAPDGPWCPLWSENP